MLPHCAKITNKTLHMSENCVESKQAIFSPDYYYEIQVRFYTQHYAQIMPHIDAENMILRDNTTNKFDTSFLCDFWVENQFLALF